MKTRIATAISVVGVLGAGSAAALVNTQILEGGAAEPSASAAVLPTASSVDVTIPEVPADTLPTESTSPTTEPTTTSVPESTVPAEPAPTGYLTAFNVGEAGVVTVDVIDGLIVLVEAAPKSGWSISDTSEDSDNNEVEVEFASGSVRVEFEATFVDGQIVPEVSSRRVGGSGAPAGTPAPPAAAPVTTIDDDHDDGHDDEDGHESDDDYEDHDDDHESEDDHDEDERDEEDDHDEDERDEEDDHDEDHDDEDDEDRDDD